MSVLHGGLLFQKTAQSFAGRVKERNSRGKKIRQDVAVTGEISLQGRVRPVGGVFEKAYGAKQAGIKILVIPKENAKDIPKGHLGLKIFAVDTAEEAFKKIFSEPIEFVDEQKLLSTSDEKISLSKDEQIKKISSTIVTPEELEMLTSE